MNRLTAFVPATDGGQDLLDRHISSLASRFGMTLNVVRPPMNRAHAVRAEYGRTDCIVWDASVEDERGVYDALCMLTKTRRKNILVSRTPLPRNVLALNQFAPVHGEVFDNDRIGAWLARQLRIRLGVDGSDEGESPAHPGHYWMYDKPAEHFLSFRGSHQRDAEEWRAGFEREHGTTVRMVPPCEYSYATEVVTRAQMWEGIARLLREINAARRAIVYLTDDYLDSFWCVGELMCIVYLLYSTSRRNPADKSLLPRHRLDGALLTQHGSPGTRPLRAALDDIGLPLPTIEHVKRLRLLINNCDPVTAAPEAQIAPSGPARPLAWAMNRLFGFHDPEVVQKRFWSDVRIPCPRCSSPGRTPGAFDWDAFLAAPDRNGGVDAFGYFGVPERELTSGPIRCPGCGTRCPLVNRRGTRALWMPVMTTEEDQSRPVLVHQPVWEVVKE
ncbi:hypothetical protein ACWEFL_08450 [Streptomyces sp. NPDC004838]